MRRTGRQSGFTLVEVIVCLVVAGMVGTMLVTFMGQAVQKSADRVSYTQEVCSTNTTAQELVLAYTDSYLGQAGGLSDLKNAIAGGAYDQAGNRVTSDWVRLNGTQFTVQGAGESDGYLKVTITPPRGGALVFLLTP